MKEILDLKLDEVHFDLKSSITSEILLSKKNILEKVNLAFQWLRQN